MHDMPDLILGGNIKKMSMIQFQTFQLPFSNVKTRISQSLFMKLYSIILNEKMGSKMSITDKMKIKLHK